ncbi:MAG TPA: hypothetical protein PKM48_14675, partial [Parvularculaceae bacterium]|nr:hypothetical protein [Parvularculaceae bacterium]
QGELRQGRDIARGARQLQFELSFRLRHLRRAPAAIPGSIAARPQELRHKGALVLRAAVKFRG